MYYYSTSIRDSIWEKEIAPNQHAQKLLFGLASSNVGRLCCSGFQQSAISRQKTCKVR